MLYRTAHVKNDSNSFEWEISTFKIVNVLINQKKWKTKSKFWILKFWKSLPNSIGTCKWAWSDTASPIPYRNWKRFGRNPGSLISSLLAPQNKKDSVNHRRLRLENSFSCGVFSRLGPFWLSPISIFTTPP